MEATHDTDRGSQAKAISQGAVQIAREYTGRGPTKARTYIMADLVTVVMSDTLTKGERKLVEGGGEDHVLAARHHYQCLMKSELIAVVEGQLERKVDAFMSNNHLDPDLAVEMFMLAPSE